MARSDQTNACTIEGSGVLKQFLYELLVGKPPFDSESLRKPTILELLNLIDQHVPESLSRRLKTCDQDTTTEVCKKRNVDIEKLQVEFQDELDWIVMKAIERDKTRRYDSVAKFAEDLTNHLTGGIVVARPPTLAYRAKKQFKKHRTVILTTATIMILLLAGITGTTIGLFSANSSTAKAKRETKRAITARKQSERNEARANYFHANSQWNEGNVAKATELPYAIPNQHRGFEWRLAQRRFLGSDLTLYGHQWWVGGVAYSPDGSRVVSASGDKTVKLWNAHTGEELKTLNGHTDRVNDVRGRCFIYSSIYSGF